MHLAENVIEFYYQSWLQIEQSLRVKNLVIYLVGGIFNELLIGFLKIPHSWELRDESESSHDAFNHAFKALFALLLLVRVFIKLDQVHLNVVQDLHASRVVVVVRVCNLLSYDRPLYIFISDGLRWDARIAHHVLEVQIEMDVDCFVKQFPQINLV